ncbi:ABC-type multidrug transport system fused ATPase/permease subunit [Delftia acidovorans]|uniref:ABC transporter ATP-binding protein n=1 Tax=Delftia acidovorans TaxID=80866 RepID=UPI000F4BEDB1|nr:ABC transporter ATP-binding protein [Delftia acidovorans]ROQ91780.1 ABC-type multidrug transport system fused ATPase/permease subunit [Delftia acidovorans]
MKAVLQRVWRLFTPGQQRKALSMIFLIILMAGLETVGVLSIAPFLSVLARPGIIQENKWLYWAYDQFGFKDFSSFITMLGLFTMLIVVLASIFKTLTFHVVGRFVHMQRQSLSSRLLSTYLHQPYEFFLSRSPPELAKNVLSEVDQLVFDLLQPLSMLIAQGMVVGAMVILVFSYDPWMAVSIVVVLGLLYGSIYMVVRKRLARIGAARQAADTARYRTSNEVLNGVKDVKVAHAMNAYLKDFSRASHEFSRHSATAETLSHSPLYIVEAVGYSGLILVALALLWRSGDVAHVLPALGLYGFAAYRILPAVQIIYRGVARLKFSSAALENIETDLGLASPCAVDVSDAIVPKYTIELKNIVYGYPGEKNKCVIENLSVTMEANTTIGIIGPSGSGKSTLMDILLGLLQPQQGSFLVDGVPVNKGNAMSWQRSIGYVPQHIYLMDATVAENIAFGVPPELIDMKAVEHAARAAQIHDVVTNDLPLGYLTRLGDRGVRLSGGQRQRIGIARALYRDPPVLFMDEATSALDRQTEEALNKAIQGLSGRKTIVLIAHRESSLQICSDFISLKRIS